MKKSTRLSSNNSEPHRILLDRMFASKMRSKLVSHFPGALLLEELLGREEAAKAKDENWLPIAAKEGFIVFTADDRIRYNTLEKLAVVEFKVKMFCLSNNNLRPEAQAEYFCTNKSKILRASKKPGPFIYRVRKDSIAETELSN